MSNLRVVHYLNQFFAGIGSEAQADVPPGRIPGAVGPAIALQQVLGDRAEVVATVYCGDNRVVEDSDAMDTLVNLIAEEKANIFIAGPAFAAGRYGLACGQMCAKAREKLGITVVTGMHEDNAAAELYRTKVHIVSTRDRALGMREAVQRMAELSLKLQAGQPLGSPEEDGYLPTGHRVHFFAEKNAATRALEMLLKKVGGEAFTSEWPLPKYDPVTPAPPLKDLAKTKVAAITTGGLVPKGNPDRLEPTYASKWLRYSIVGLTDLSGEDWQSIHGGYDTAKVNADPDRLLPLDALRELEDAGAFGELYDTVFTTVGNTAAVPTMRRFAREMIQELKANDVGAILLTST